MAFKKAKCVMAVDMVVECLVRVGDANWYFRHVFGKCCRLALYSWTAKRGDLLGFMYYT